MKSHSPLLAEDQIDRICEQFMEEDKLGQHDAAWESLQPLVRAQPEQRRAALALLELVEGGWFSRERALELLQTIHAAHKQDDLVLSLLGTALEQARDIDMLNAAPPEHSLFAEVTECLGVRAREVTGTDIERNVVEGLSTAARMMARQYDNFAEASARRLVELAPGEPSSHYNYGLFLKTRGRFREGMIENQRALELAEEVRESYQWNLGICATGAGEGAVALEVWKRLGNKIEMGRFELPEGRYPQCKVRLAERTLAERNVDNDDPGLEETIWLERLSPCHGIIR
ncbi:MAG TPA: hypothetical protein VFS24_18250, partial [Steroidobacteraceae bacterium]|nr:hypothetical protein [Steroidobacteraceae bacterium]